MNIQKMNGYYGMSGYYARMSGYYGMNGYYYQQYKLIHLSSLKMV